MLSNGILDAMVAAVVIPDLCADVPLLVRLWDTITEPRGVSHGWAAKSPSPAVRLGGGGGQGGGRAGAGGSPTGAGGHSFSVVFGN